MYSFATSQVISGDPQAVWAVWTDPDRFPRWDPREERTALRGPFAVGSTIDAKQKGIPGGEVTISAIDPGRSWTATSALPGGMLTIDHRVAAAGDGRVLVSKFYTATGPLTLLFRLYFGPLVQRTMPASFAALEAEARTRLRHG